MRRLIIAAVLALLAVPVSAQTSEQLAQIDTMRADMVSCIGFIRASDTQWTKWAAAPDTVTKRVEGVRGRGFIRAAETVCLKPLARLDALVGNVTPEPPPVEPPTPEPEPEPEPPVEPEPEPPAPPTDPGDAFVADDFEAHRDGALLRDAGSLWGNNGGAVTASSDRAHTGRMSARFRFNGRGAEQRFSLGRSVDELWLAFWIYLPSNYRHTSDGGSDNNKFFRLWGGDYNAQNKVGASTWPGDGGASRLRFDYVRSINQAIGPGESPSAVWGDASMLGRWTRVRIHARHASSAQDDGVLQIWADDALILDFQRVDQKYTSPASWNSGYLLGSTNATLPQMDVFVDDVRFYDVNPGWVR